MHDDHHDDHGKQRKNARFPILGRGAPAAGGKKHLLLLLVFGGTCAKKHMCLNAFGSEHTRR